MNKIFERNERNSSIELLRVICIMGIILLHFNNKNNGGAFSFVAEGSINQYYLFFIESVFAGAVNLFIMISGYCLCNTQKRRLSKIIELLFQVSFFRVMLFFFGIIWGGKSFSWTTFLGSFLPLNYFVALYSSLYIISPYINILLTKLNKKAFNKLLITSFMLFSLWTIVIDYFRSFTGMDVSWGLSTISMQGNLDGYSIVNFCLSYLMGTYIRKYNISISTLRVVLGLISVIVALTLLSIIEHYFGKGEIVTWNYNNPLLFAASSLALLLFLNYNFKSRIINEISGATFTCFLIHTFVYSFLCISEAVSGSLIKIIVNQCLAILISYSAAYLLYKVFYLSTFWFFNKLKRIICKIDISVNNYD